MGNSLPNGGKFYLYRNPRFEAKRMNEESSVGGLDKGFG